MWGFFVSACEDPAAQIWHHTRGWGGGVGRSAGQFPSLLFFLPTAVSRTHKDLNPSLPHLPLVLLCARIARSLPAASKAAVRDTAQRRHGQSSAGRDAQTHQFLPASRSLHCSSQTKGLHPSLLPYTCLSCSPTFWRKNSYQRQK